MRRITGAALLFCIAAGGQAQNVIAADAATAQPTIRRDDAGFSACGVRVVAALFSPKDAEIYDFSVNIDAAVFMGTMKAGKYSAPRDKKGGWDFDKRRVTLPDPVQFWIAEQSADLPLQASRFGKSANAGFSLGLAEFEKTVPVVLAVAAGKPMQFAVRYPADRVDRVIRMNAQMAQADVDALSDCLDGLERRLVREADTHKKP